MNIHNQGKSPFQVPRWRLSRLDRCVIDAQYYFWVNSDSEAHSFQDEATGRAKSLTHEEVYRMRSEGRFTCLHNYHALHDARLRKETEAQRFADLSKKDKSTVLWKKEFCERFMMLESQRQATRGELSMKAAIETINAAICSTEIQRQTAGKNCKAEITVRKPPSPSTLRGWLRQYKAWDYNPLFLKDNFGRSGNRHPRLSPEIYQLLHDMAERFGDPRRPSKVAVYDKLLIELRKINAERAISGQPNLPAPSIQALSNRIRQLNQFEVMSLREGEAAAKKHFYKMTRGHEVFLPLEEVEMDEWDVSLRLLVVKAGIRLKLTKEQRLELDKTRVWISVAIDRATRCVLAIHLVAGSPSAKSALATVQMVVSDKSKIARQAGCQTPWDMGGHFDAICSDTGAAFISLESQAAVADLGSEMMFPPGGLPQMRGRIERVFGTIHTRFVSLLHGRTFINPVVRGDYDSDASAIFDAEEFKRLLIRYIVDVYHNTPHEGLQGETPRNAWLRLNREFETRMPIDDELARHIFGVTDEREVRREGIEYSELFYRDDKLQDFRREKGQKSVLIRVDETNLGRISVRLPSGWLTVGCARDGMEGVSLQEWKAACEQTRLKFKDEAKITHDIRLQALEDIRQYVRQGAAEAKLDIDRYGSRKQQQLERSMNYGRATNTPEDDAGDFFGEDSSDELANVTSTEAHVHHASGADGLASSFDDPEFGDDDDDYDSLLEN
ncbi:putative transposase [Phyllobacterium sp. 1468]|uniref:Mu transposase C-terminal domain-containing protein n=1 Tax=Phyllobacterium sp. 1468 TaxID=2817759 RepID=UPI002866414F|nr:Mu transposase C-terminal domain-containing protein [Phyllobacterium sp. 1468]MDR6632653.1 putative transposase [Phyllobacterium sp. 1468]